MVPIPLSTPIFFGRTISLTRDFFSFNHTSIRITTINFIYLDLSGSGFTIRSSNTDPIPEKTEHFFTLIRFLSFKKLFFLTYVITFQNF
jgi:hypothetical protein